MYYLIIFLCLYSVHGSSYVNYKEIEKLGNSCPMLDSCDYLKTLPTDQQTSVRKRYCSCDFSCSEYDDCCIDAIRTMNGKRNDLSCLQVEQTGGVFMKDSCPASFKGSEAVRSLCEKTKLGDQVDPLAALPVTDPLTGLTYKNYYCSLCNGNTNNIVMWTPKLECPLLNLMNNSNAITAGYVLENLATDGQNWGLYLSDDSDGSEFFHDCYVYPVMPTRLEGKIRLCKSNVISDCPSSWKDEGTRTLCRSYAGVRYDMDGNSYKNMHCAACNGVNATKLSCQSVDEIDVFREFGTYSFAILLDVGGATGEEVGKIRLCNRGEVFDPFFKKCRSVLCLPGFVRRGRRCVVRNPMEFVRFYSGSNRRTITFTTTRKYQDNNSTSKHDMLLSTTEPGNFTSPSV